MKVNNIINVYEPTRLLQMQCCVAGPQNTELSQGLLLEFTIIHFNYIFKVSKGGTDQNFANTASFNGALY